LKDKKKFCEIIFCVADNFSAKVTDRTLKFWWEMFQEDSVTINQIAQAAKQIIRTRKYTNMPTYADFIEHIKGKVDDAAEIQAILCVDESRKYSPGELSPAFDDPITAYLMKHRWPFQNWAMSLLEAKIQWWVKEFKSAYLSFDRNKLNDLMLANESQKRIGSPDGK